MDKQFEQLTKLAKKYDEESNFKQADEITELMIKIAQSSMPIPQKPAEQKGVLESLGSAMGQGLGAIGKGISQGVKAVGKGVQNAWNSGAIGGAIQGSTAVPSGGASLLTPWLAQKYISNKNANTRDQIYQEKAQGRYQINLAIKNILDQTADQTKSNNFNEEQARTKAKNLAKQLSNLNYLNTQAKSIYKTSFEDMVDLEFDRYNKPYISNTP
jgi:hypothetical protein